MCWLLVAVEVLVVTTQVVAVAVAVLFITLPYFFLADLFLLL
jgi:hypothetical protein